jgi:hypothetical protein
MANPIKNLKSKMPGEKEQAMMDHMNHALAEIYKNKSADEYKMRGDISLSSEYATIERMVSDLKILKGFSSSEADDIKMLFLTLHRPVFKKMVSEYLASPNERNQTFTTVFTVGYRLLVGELSRIFASTEATDKGIAYKPDKISRKENAKWLIKHFNKSLEQRIDTYIRSHANKQKPVQEALVEISDGFGAVAGIIATVFDVLNLIFTGAKELNPISFINAMLTRSYDNKVKKFEEVSAMYNATKEAYDEYMKIPKADRKEKIESKYVKNIDKYNIKMQNLAAQIEHYDSRAKEEVKDIKSSPKPKATSVPKGDTTTPAKPTGDESEETDTKDTPNDDNGGGDDTGGFDF